MNVFERLARLQRIHTLAFSDAGGAVSGAGIFQNEWALRAVRDDQAARQEAQCGRRYEKWFARVGRYEAWHDDPMQALAMLEKSVEDSARAYVDGMIAERGQLFEQAKELAATLSKSCNERTP